ncbi:MAG TPA: hypothetical protein DCX06_05215 [Opitutae bacterium]|nr:hypothetical protein [Opitutae bacterium]
MLPLHFRHYLVIFLSLCGLIHATPPNIVLFFVDDLGWSDLGFRNNDFETPHIDALAAESVDFVQCYIPSPTCSPSRAGLLSGKHPARLQMTRHIPWNEDGAFHLYDNDPGDVPSRNWLPLKHVTYAEALKELGYYHLFLGKWHLGPEGFHPTDQGFDRQIGTTNQGNPSSYYPDYFRSSDEFDEEDQAYLTDKLTDEAVTFIKGYDQDNPFMMSFWYYSVHTPHIGRRDYVSHFEEKGFQGKEAHYMAMVKSVDDSVGRVRDALEDKGITDETVIIFLSDQGGYFENSPFRGGKMGGTALYEGGARVPMFIQWPGVTQAGEVQDAVQSLDLFPTLVEIAGGDSGGFIELDGISLVEPLRDQKRLDRGAPIFGYRSYEDLYASVREREWKLMAHRSGKLELYNIKEDPAEGLDLSEKYPAIMKSLKTKLKHWERDMGVAKYSGVQEVIDVKVADYGACPDDGADDTLAIKQALEVCKQHELSRLVFEPGVYDFYPTYAGERYLFVSNNDEGLKRIAFDMVGMENVTIEGGGAQFMFHGAMNPFVAEHSKNILLTNFSIDFSRPFHSEAIILGVEKEYMDVEIVEGHPFLLRGGMLYFTENQVDRVSTSTVSKNGIYGSAHMLEYDTVKRETAFMVRDHYFLREGGGYPATHLEGRKVRINVPNLRGTVGNTMVFGPNHRDHPGIVLTKTENVRIDKVTIHHAGGMGILGQNSRNIVVNDCKVTPSGNRMNSTTADATHFVNCTGKIELTNNLFENQKDDATNIHGVYQRIVEATGDDSIIVRFMHNQQMGFDYLQTGTEIEFVRSNSLLTYGKATVKSVHHINKECSEVTLTEKLPADLKIGDAIAEIRDYPEVLIANNIIRNNRARGMLLNCRGRTVVENNYFHAPGAAILFEGDAAFWYEQGGVSDCVIRNNVFDNCLFGVWGKAVIDVKAGIQEDRELSRYNRNIKIANNTFRVFDKVTLLDVYCVDGLVWENNTIESTKDYPDRERNAQRFIVQHSDNVVIDGSLID